MTEVCECPVEEDRAVFLRAYLEGRPVEQWYNGLGWVDKNDPYFPKPECCYRIKGEKND